MVAELLSDNMIPYFLLILGYLVDFQQQQKTKKRR